ncbi:hypothetical protein PAPYR_9035 [Paratrimastix pyriformis]|uniref:Uncharacterized protein n=1 Tax=Paratrimastix pyriformis TaxID=342808 RepID=A0ABQ8U9B1_9EUKA|nr:hypothetical protein PAPYR_9035 [Paratrimastix pyriformis]
MLLSSSPSRPPPFRCVVVFERNVWRDGMDCNVVMSTQPAVSSKKAEAELRWLTRPGCGRDQLVHYLEGENLTFGPKANMDSLFLILRTNVKPAAKFIGLVSKRRMRTAKETTQQVVQWKKEEVHTSSQMAAELSRQASRAEVAGEEPICEEGPGVEEIPQSQPQEEEKEDWPIWEILAGGGDKEAPPAAEESQPEDEATAAGRARTGRDDVASGCATGHQGTGAEAGAEGKAPPADAEGAGGDEEAPPAAAEDSQPEDEATAAGRAQTGRDDVATGCATGHQGTGAEAGADGKAPPADAEGAGGDKEAPPAAAGESQPEDEATAAGRAQTGRDDVASGCATGHQGTGAEAGAGGKAPPADAEGAGGDKEAPPAAAGESQPEDEATAAGRAQTGRDDVASGQPEDEATAAGRAQTGRDDVATGCATGHQGTGAEAGADGKAPPADAEGAGGDKEAPPAAAGESQPEDEATAAGRAQTGRDDVASGQPEDEATAAGRAQTGRDDVASGCATGHQGTGAEAGAEGKAPPADAEGAGGDEEAPPAAAEDSQPEDEATAAGRAQTGRDDVATGCATGHQGTGAEAGADGKAPPADAEGAGGDKEAPPAAAGESQPEDEATAAGRAQTGRDDVASGCATGHQGTGAEAGAGGKAPPADAEGAGGDKEAPPAAAGESQPEDEATAAGRAQTGRGDVATGCATGHQGTGPEAGAGGKAPPANEMSQAQGTTAADLILQAVLGDSGPNAPRPPILVIPLDGFRGIEPGPGRAAWQATTQMDPGRGTPSQRQLAREARAIRDKAIAPLRWIVQGMQESALRKEAPRIEALWRKWMEAGQRVEGQGQGEVQPTPDERRHSEQTRPDQAGKEKAQMQPDVAADGGAGPTPAPQDTSGSLRAAVRLIWTMTRQNRWLTEALKAHPESQELVTVLLKVEAGNAEGRRTGKPQNPVEIPKKISQQVADLLDDGEGAVKILERLLEPVMEQLKPRLRTQQTWACGGDPGQEDPECGLVMPSSQLTRWMGARGQTRCACGRTHRIVRQIRGDLLFVAPETGWSPPVEISAGDNYVIAAGLLYHPGDADHHAHETAFQVSRNHRAREYVEGDEHSAVSWAAVGRPCRYQKLSRDTALLTFASGEMAQRFMNAPIMGFKDGLRRSWAPEQPREVARQGAPEQGIPGQTQAEVTQSPGVNRPGAAIPRAVGPPSNDADANLAPGVRARPDVGARGAGLGHGAAADFSATGAPRLLEWRAEGLRTPPTGAVEWGERPVVVLADDEEDRAVGAIAHGHVVYLLEGRRRRVYVGSTKNHWIFGGYGKRPFFLSLRLPGLAQAQQAMIGGLCGRGPLTCDAGDIVKVVLAENSGVSTSKLTADRTLGHHTMPTCGLQPSTWGLIPHHPVHH